VDKLVEGINKPIKSDQKRHKALRDFNILIDYRWLTEGKKIGAEKAKLKLAEKYIMEPRPIDRIRQEFLS